MRNPSHGGGDRFWRRSCDFSGLKEPLVRMPTCLPQSPPHPAQLHKWADRAVYAFCLTLLLGSFLLVRHTTRPSESPTLTSNSPVVASKSATTSASSGATSDATADAVRLRSLQSLGLRDENSAAPAGTLQPIAWVPEADKYLLTTCTHGHVADRLVCLQRYVLVAAALNRTLVVPEGDLCDARAAPGHIQPSVSFARVIDLAKLEGCLTGSSRSRGSSSGTNGGSNGGGGGSGGAPRDARPILARKLSNAVPSVTGTRGDHGGDHGGDNGADSGGETDSSSTRLVITLTRFLQLKRMESVHVDSLVCGHSTDSCSLPRHCSITTASHTSQPSRAASNPSRLVTLPRRADRMAPFASTIADFAPALLASAPRAYRAPVLSLGDLRNFNASDLIASDPSFAEAYGVPSNWRTAFQKLLSNVLSESCTLPFQPSSEVTELADWYRREYIGSDYAALHLERRDYIERHHSNSEGSLTVESEGGEDLQHENEGQSFESAVDKWRTQVTGLEAGQRNGQENKTEQQENRKEQQEQLEGGYLPLAKVATLVGDALQSQGIRVLFLSRSVGESQAVDETLTALLSARGISVMRLQSVIDLPSSVSSSTASSSRGSDSSTYSISGRIASGSTASSESDRDDGFGVVDGDGVVVGGGEECEEHEEREAESEAAQAHTAAAEGALTAGAEIGVTELLSLIQRHLRPSEDVAATADLLIDASARMLILSPAHSSLHSSSTSSSSSSSSSSTSTSTSSSPSSSLPTSIPSLSPSAIHIWNLRRAMGMEATSDVLI